MLETFGNIEITIFNSNEEAIQKLVTAGGNGGFDMMCPTGVYIPQLVGEDLLQELDLSRIPNFKNLDTPYTNQPWDPGNKYSVCKDWGSTGWIYDKTVIDREIKTWADFIDVAMNEASGNVSVLDAPNDLCGVYFWANDIDWNTTDPAELAACEDFMVNEFAQHIKAFDSYPGINLTQGNYALSQAWNGDARQGLVSVQAAGGDPDDYGWAAVGAPETELWMDNWCILKDAENIDAAYNFMNYILDPEVSAKEIAFHGYNTAVKGSREALPADAPFLDMVYFTDEEVSRMRGRVARQPGRGRRDLQQGQGRRRGLSPARQQAMTSTVGTPPVPADELARAGTADGSRTERRRGRACPGSVSRSRRHCGGWRSSWCRSCWSWRPASGARSRTRRAG